MTALFVLSIAVFCYLIYVLIKTRKILANLPDDQRCNDASQKQMVLKI